MVTVRTAAGGGLAVFDTAAAVRAGLAAGCAPAGALAALLAEPNPR
jgi:hypothetical protein